MLTIVACSCLDVKLKDYGSECIEVSDNGSGVHSDNFQGLSKNSYVI